MIDVVMLGTGSMAPLPDRALSSMVIRCGRSRILFDCGEGTQVAIREHGWGFIHIDAICFSHIHADHTAGLPGLLHTMAHAGRTRPVTIFGPARGPAADEGEAPGIREVVQGLCVIAPDLPFAVNVVELAPGQTVDGPRGLRISVAAGEHRAPVLGYRFALDRGPAFEPHRAKALGVPTPLWSRLVRGEAVRIGEREVRPEEVLGPPRRGLALGIVTDTRRTEALVDLVRGVSLLICEGTYGDDADIEKAVRNGHMTFREAAGIARDAGARHLWLTHFSSGMDDPERWRANAESGEVPVTMGRPGLRATLRFDADPEVSEQV